MQCKETEVVLEQQDDFVALPEGVRQHVSGCSSCQNLVADFTAIVKVARELPAEVEPPPRIWASLRMQLEAEGLIKTQLVLGRSSWWRLPELFHTRALATASVGLLILAGAVLQIPQSAPEKAAKARSLLADTGLTLREDERGLMNMQLASDSVVDASLRKNLEIVDSFIEDCEKRMKDDPENELAREYLSGAYRQKAELLSVMMERGRSVN
jgi:hypothetical protein